MTVFLLLLALSALIGFGVGTSFRWPAIAASSVGIAVLSSTALQIQSFGALTAIAIVIACLTVSQMGYLAASLRRGRLFQQQAHKEPSQDRKGDIGQQQQKPPLRDKHRLSRFMFPARVAPVRLGSAGPFQGSAFKWSHRAPLGAER